MNVIGDIIKTVGRFYIVKRRKLKIDETRYYVTDSLGQFNFSNLRKCEKFIDTVQKQEAENAS